jgi:hypothetical protein
LVLRLVLFASARSSGFVACFGVSGWWLVVAVVGGFCFSGFGGFGPPFFAIHQDYRAIAIGNKLFAINGFKLQRFIIP